MISKIFLSTKNKDSFNPINSRSISLGNSLEERNKLKELKLINNLSNMKLNKNYIDKCSLLLHTCHQTKNYSYKRKNIGKTIYKYDENNELCITLPKFKETQKNNDGQKIEITIPNEKYKTIAISENNDFSKRKNFILESKSKDSIIKRNSRNTINRDDSENLYLERMTLPKILTNSSIFSNNSLKSNSVAASTINQNKNSETTALSNYGENENYFNELRNNQKKIFSYISGLNSINQKDNSHSIKHKNRRHNVYYQNVFINNQKNEAQKLYTSNKKNKKEDEGQLKFENQMQKMKNDINKLHEESYKAEGEVNTTIQKIDSFLNKKEFSTRTILQTKNSYLRAGNKKK